jgi:APA family basic amino acid/polyamine antiporter
LYFSRNATPYGLWLLILLDLAAIAGLTTVAIAVLLAQSRIFYAMAHDGLLPPIFAKLHSRTKTPWISIIISGKYSFCVIDQI